MRILIATARHNDGETERRVNVTFTTLDTPNPLELRDML